MYIFFKLINNSLRKFKRNQYLTVFRNRRKISQILLTLISIFSENIDEQLQTLESVHPLNPIAKYRQAG